MLTAPKLPESTGLTSTNHALVCDGEIEVEMADFFFLLQLGCSRSGLSVLQGLPSKEILLLDFHQAIKAMSEQQDAKDQKRAGYFSHMFWEGINRCETQASFVRVWTDESSLQICIKRISLERKALRTN